MYAPDGRVALWLKANSSTTLFTNSGATVTITIDASGNMAFTTTGTIHLNAGTSDITLATTGKINANGTGGLWVNGTQVTVP